MQKATAIPAARFDFDGDGKDEVVAGSPRVTIKYSSGREPDVFWPEQVSGFCSPNFGDHMAAGDFNGDDRTDLAVTDLCAYVPGQTPAFGGAVYVYYGNATGLDLLHPQHLNQETPNFPGVTEAYDHFGRGLAAGDVDGDGIDELAIGVPGDPVGGVTQAGTVTVIRGVPGGLMAGGFLQIDQSFPGAPGDPVQGGAFGNSVAIGDFTGDGLGDVVVATTHSGEVTLIPGTPHGLLEALTGPAHPTYGQPIDVMMFGNLNGDGHQDLIMSASATMGGSIYYVPGNPVGLGSAGIRQINQDTPGVPGPVEHHSDGTHGRFGSSLATGDVDGDGYDDVVVGATGVDVGTVIDAGAAFLIPGGPDGPTGAGTVFLHQSNPDPLQAAPGRRPTPAVEIAEPLDYFGTSVGILNLDGTGPLEILVGTTRERITEAGGDTGVIILIRATPATPQRTGGGTAGFTWVMREAWSALDMRTTQTGGSILGGAVL